MQQNSNPLLIINLLKRKKEASNLKFIRDLILLLLVWSTFTFSLQAATFTVTNTNDSGAGSLRQAIIDANATTAADIIEFDITGGGVHTLTPGSPYPTIIHPVLIDGSSQTGYLFEPVIHLNAGSISSVINISNVANTTIKALCISNGRGDAIVITNGTSTIIED